MDLADSPAPFRDLPEHPAHDLDLVRVAEDVDAPAIHSGDTVAVGREAIDALAFQGLFQNAGEGATG